MEISSYIRLERTSVTLVTNDLERTWNRIAPDMSMKMQSALGILRHVMGFFYEDTCVVAWNNGDLIGIAVYATTYDVNLGIRDTRIKELASFTYEPGVGKALVEDVVKIGREENSDIVSASYGPGAKGFYDVLGFVQNTYYPEEPTLLMYRLSGNPEMGTCYEDAWRFLIKQDEGVLVHGSVRLYEGGREVNHAWVELPSGHIWEPQTGQYFTLKDFEITSPTEHHRYTIEEAAIMVARVGKHGPWTEEERMKHIGR